MYIDSSCAQLTPQGRSIKAVAVKFGDGETLPFTPCKKGYIPMVNGEKMYACRIHHKERMKRLVKEGGRYRAGEKKLDDFWTKQAKKKDQKTKHVGGGGVSDKKHKNQPDNTEDEVRENGKMGKINKKIRTR